MSKYFFDYDDGDFAFSISDYMAMDMNSGEIHLTSEWPSEENND